MQSKATPQTHFLLPRKKAPCCVQSLLDRLWRFICEGKFQEGDRLPPERELAEKLGVSRASLRKAIQVLAERGLLASRRGAGTFVRAALSVLSHSSAGMEDLGIFYDILEAREFLEPQIAELACLRHTGEQLDLLKIITCDQQRRLLTGQDDGDLDAAFHVVLAQCTGNTAFVEIIKSINDRYRHCRFPELRDAQWRQFSVDSHLRIIDALERRSIPECRAAIMDHLMYVRRNHPYTLDNI